MSKSILSLLAAALVCIAATSAQADNGISSGTLQAMGLSGLTVMSDSDAMSIRGMGYRGKSKYQAKIKSSAEAEGRSWAKAEIEDGEYAEAETGSRNSYEAEGTHYASGENFSEATVSKTNSTTTTLPDGTSASVTTVYSIHVEAGGFSSATAF
jgi:hypothetical protein